MDELLYALKTNEQETSTSVTLQKFVFSAIQLILNVFLAAINLINENFSFALPTIMLGNGLFVDASIQHRE
uniref:Uncharacterized protein n=1 Tax=Romanomermis culicivorax TaxID=13658 RepID=A0A915IAA2_ROMCU